MREYLAFVKERLPDTDPADGSSSYGYTIAQLAVLILRRCGDELTRANVMNQATTLADVDLPMLLPGIRLSNNPTSHAPFHSLRMQRFDGTKWVLFGDVVGAHETASR
jgi:branched-chain amino acid transport system substrate-binding protein